MFPLILDPQKMAILVIGNGPATTRRHQLLNEAGADYAYRPDDATQEELQAADVVFVADFDTPTSAQLYARAKAAKCMVNVEDKADYCDFHVPAIVRRGDLLLTVSTRAASPRLARRLRMMLEQLFPAAWAQHIEQIRTARTGWKAQNLSMQQVAENTDQLLDANGWLQANCPCLQASENRHCEQSEAIHTQATASHA